MNVNLEKFWTTFLVRVQDEFECWSIPACPTTTLEAVASSLSIPISLAELYRHANGLGKVWFRVLPIEDEKNIKKTWDGIRRANLKREEQLGPELLERFLLFAEIGDGRYGLMDRSDQSIWLETENDLERTNLDLPQFIELSLKEVG